MGKRYLLLFLACGCAPAPAHGEPRTAAAPPEPLAQAEASTETSAAPATGSAEREQQAKEPRGPKYVSFTLRNACRQTVKLFFGETPKFSSGRTDSMSGNSMRSERLKEGQTIWLLDASGNGQSSFTVSSSTKQLVVGPSCTGFQTTYP